MTRPTRRAIAVVYDEDLDRVLTTSAHLDLAGAHVLDVKRDPIRAATLILITRDDLDEVPPGVEPLRMLPDVIEPPQ